MSSILDVDVNKVISSTDFYKTRSVSEDGKTITFHNNKVAFRCRAIPAIVASRLFGRYPIEIMSWCYLGLAIRKNAILSMIKTLQTKEVEVAKEPEWEDDDVVDTVWNVINKSKTVAIEVAPYEEMDNPNAYLGLANAKSCSKFNDQDTGLLEIMVVSTAVLRLTYDSFFLEYKTFLESELEISKQQGNLLGMNIPSILLDLWNTWTAESKKYMEETKALLKKKQTEAREKTSKQQ